MVDARGYGIVRAALQGIYSGFIGEFSGYGIPTEQSDQVSGAGHRDNVH